MKNVTPASEMLQNGRGRPKGTIIAPPTPDQRRKANSGNKLGIPTGEGERTKAALRVVSTRTDEEIAAEIEEKAAGRRVQYMPMKVHMEKAAMALAAGYNQRRAAKFANVHPRQIRKYMQSADFRDRIMEHRQIVMSSIQGQLIREVGRRVSPQKIGSLEPLDLVRFYNMTTGGKDKGLADGVTVNIKYDQTFNAIVAAVQASDAESEGGDFPEYGPEDLLLPGADSSGD